MVAAVAHTVTGDVSFTSLLVGVAFVGAAALTSRFSPGTPTWWLLLLVGVLRTISAGTVEAFVPWRYTLALGLEDAWIPVLAYLALAHPGPRLRGAVTRRSAGRGATTRSTRSPSASGACSG